MVGRTCQPHFCFLRSIRTGVYILIFHFLTTSNVPGLEVTWFSIKLPIPRTCIVSGFRVVGRFENLGGVIRWFGELVDLIFDFFDPIEQKCTFLFFIF